PGKEGPGKEDKSAKSKRPRTEDKATKSSQAD
ncbi:hypothetical protein Tco_1242094, partial [Tanacetum coccineum]